MLTNSLTVVSLVVALVTAAPNVDPRCGRYTLDMNAQVLSYQLDCRKFVICDMGGHGQILSCPAGLYFSPEEHACSYDSIACTHGELDGTGVPVPSVPNVPPKPQPLPPVKVPEQPVKVPEQPVKVPELPVKVPVPPVVLPQIPNLPIVVTAPPVPKPLPIITAAPSIEEPVQERVDPNEERDLDTLHFGRTCENQAVGNVFPLMSDCMRYIVCLGDGQAISVHCPTGLMYDYKQKRCDFAGIALCATPRWDEPEHEVLEEEEEDLLDDNVQRSFENDA